jgi:hypothetical protein
MWIGAVILAHDAIGSERLSHLENPSLVYFTELRGTFYIGQSLIAVASILLGFVAVAVRRVVFTG